MNIIRAFLPARRYARLLAIAMCLCLPVSVTSRCSIETHGRIELLFGIEASFGRSYTVLGISIVETCSQISSRKLRVINWAVVVAKSTIPATVDC